MPDISVIQEISHFKYGPSAQGRTVNTIQNAVESARGRIEPYIRKTPLERSPMLSKEAGAEVWLKLENIQHTGSFKLRGALNALLSLSPQQRQRGITTASTGNHALAIAYGLDRLELAGTIFLPTNASPQKIEMLRNYNVEISFFGDGCEQAEMEARRIAENQSQAYISPYNHPDVMAGQGTVAPEILEQLPSVDCIITSVGGGGLIGGIAGYAKAVNPEIQIIGALPENSPVMFDSIRAGKIIDSVVKPTLSDATAGGMDQGAITFEPARRFVDHWVLISETEIQAAMKCVFEHQRLVIEGAAGVAVAASLKLRTQLKDRKVAIVICGGNVDIGKFKELVF
jgi:threonine dehydratase